RHDRAGQPRRGTRSRRWPTPTCTSSRSPRATTTSTSRCDLPRRVAPTLKRTEDGTVLLVNYSADTIDKINFDNPSVIDTIWELADSDAPRQIHPDLMD